jgi:RHS repeat-associated protein
MQATFPGNAGTVDIFDLSYDFHLSDGDNGNVWGITNNRDATRSLSFTYDQLNRLASAQNAGTDCSQTTVNGKTKFWGNGYTYDAWGNLMAKGNLPGATSPKCNSESLDRTADAQNRLHVKVGADYQYDAAGNMTYDAAGQYYAYDQENRITGAGGLTYTYDADGNRVEKSTGGSSPTGMLYWYMSLGVVAESDLQGNLQSEYIFFDGERVARRDNPSTNGPVSYYLSDYLKTTDIVTDARGNIKNESDFYPWGGELQFVATGSNHYKFTGKERDSETGLDYFGARYYSNGLGRFITPDWSAVPVPVPVPYAHFDDPQTLNIYSYVRNNSASLYDPDGHCWKWAQGLCNLGQRISNGVSGYGFHTDQQVEQTHHDTALLLHQQGVEVEKLSHKQITKYGFAVAALKSRPSAAQARAIWEKATGKTVPWDAKYNRFYDMAHKTAIGDGGLPRDANKLFPQQHDEHVEFHKENGDFARWGSRANQNQAGQAAAAAAEEETLGEQFLKQQIANPPPTKEEMEPPPMEQEY